MILYLVGISCVGKTTIGKILAKKLGYIFFDLDLEIQNYYNKPIERIQDECLTIHHYRKKASFVLDKLLTENINCVISGTPSGLKPPYYQVYKKYKDKGLISIHLYDSPNNILNRIRFYDKDSNPIKVKLNKLMKKRYLKEIEGDYDYFKNSYKKADYQINIENLGLEKISETIAIKIGLTKEF